MTGFRKPEGVNLSLGRDVPAALLAQALCRAVAFVQDTEPDGAPLQLYHDWWEHDGLHFHRRNITLHHLFEMVQSPRTLLAAMPGDEDVFVGVAPDSGGWYLRFYLRWADDDVSLVGRFDITVSAPHADRLRQRVFTALSLPVREQEAGAYYRSIGASPSAA